MTGTSATSTDRFAACDMRSCCLCGSTHDLSGEHKIKAASLRAEFGHARMVIGPARKGRVRLAQSAGSKALHFVAPVCGKCNSARTQHPDRAFDEFHADVRRLIRDGADPAAALDEPQFAPGSEGRRDLHRYFAKLLCCHLAGIGAPRQVALADFALGNSNVNCILLAVDHDETYRRAQEHVEYAGLPYAAHGGLLVFGNKETLYPTAFYSTLTIGPARYKYKASLTEHGQRMLRVEAPAFFNWCRERVRTALATPLDDQTLLRLGLHQS